MARGPGDQRWDVSSEEPIKGQTTYERTRGFSSGVPTTNNPAGGESSGGENEVGGGEEGGEEGPYADMTNAELQAELENRGLATSGNKAELIARLEEHDAS